MKKNLTSLIAAIFIGLSILACNAVTGKSPVGDSAAQPTSAQPEGSSAEVPATQAPAASSSSGACDNPYIPVIMGATWNYTITGTASDTYVHSITAVDEAGFTEQDVFGKGITRSGQWKCDNGNLIALNPSGGGTANVSAENITADFTTTSLTGVTFPADATPGNKWQQSITLEGTEKISDMEIPAKTQTDTSCTAGGTESVTVAAGTFDALRVDCENKIHIVITMSGNDVPTDVAMTSTSWYAPEVGLLKTVSKGSNFDSTIELTSYTIP